MIEENLQLHRKQQQVLEKEGLEFAEFSEAFTDKFDKIKKLTRDKLEGITAEIMRTDDEIHKFIEKTKKDFENFVKVLEEKEVQQNVQEEAQIIEAVEPEVQEKVAQVTDLEQRVQENTERIEALEGQVQEKERRMADLEQSI